MPELVNAKIVYIGTRQFTSAHQVMSLATTGSSVSEVVANLLQNNGLPMDPDIATNLVMGIEAGSSNFSSSETTAVTFEVFANLLRAGGVRRPKIVENFPAGAIPSAQPAQPAPAPQPATVAQHNLYPPIDLSASSTSALKRSIVGSEHFEVAIQFQKMLSEYNSLAHIVAIVGESELSAQDRLLYQRTKKIINYLTQPFFMTEAQSGKRGVYVARAEAVADISMIISGKLDSVPEDKFLYIGNIKDIK
jgi:hypothetical protein